MAACCRHCVPPGSTGASDTQLHLRLVVQQDVRGLDVAVDVPQLVQVAEPLERVLEDIRELGLRQTLPQRLQRVVDAAEPAVLHEDLCAGCVRRGRTRTQSSESVL